MRTNLNNQGRSFQKGQRFLLILPLYFLFILYLPWYTLPDFPSISSQASWPLLSKNSKDSPLKKMKAIQAILLEKEIFEWHHSYHLYREKYAN